MNHETVIHPRQHRARCHLLVEVRVESDLLNVLGLAEFHERFPRSVVGVENLKKCPERAQHGQTQV